MKIDRKDYEKTLPVLAKKIEQLEKRSTDYVVATETAKGTGLMGTWKIRKWASGYCEAYTTTVPTGYPCNNDYGNGFYYAVLNQPLPNKLFKTVEYVLMSRSDMTGGGTIGLLTASPYGINTSTMNWYAINLKNETITASFAIRVVGTWK